MFELEVGKLYTCEKFHLMFYPDPEAALAAERTNTPFYPAAPNGGNPATFANFWSNRLGKPVLLLEKNVLLLVLDSKEKFYEVLVEDKKGWIIYRDFLNIKEIV